VARLTVFILTYNRPTLLQVAIDSVVNQTFKDLDFRILDDASTNPQALEILDRYHCRTVRGPAYTAKQKTEEICSAGALYNMGLAQTDSEFVCYLGNGAAYLPNRCARFIKFLDVTQGCDMVWGQQNNIYFDDNGTETGRERKEDHVTAGEVHQGPSFHERISRGNYIDACSVVERRNDIPWSTSPLHWRTMDWERWKVFAGRGLRADFYPIVGEEKFVSPTNLGRMLAEGKSFEEILEARK
jgi:glycosyltransferase involved in cell wall biosynthesis